MRTRRRTLPTLAAALGAAWGAAVAALPVAAQPSIRHDPEDPRPADAPSPARGRPVPDGDKSSAEAKADDPSAADPRPVAAVLSATSNGLDQLRQAVFDAPFTEALSVGDAFRRLRSDEAVGRLIQSAEQRGPPRWFDTARCEVRLELSGSAVADAIQAAAQARHDDPDLSTRRLAPDLARLRRQTFSVVGTSSAAGAGSGVATAAAPAGDDAHARPSTNRPSASPSVARASDVRLPAAPPPVPPATPPSPSLSGGPSPSAGPSRGFAASPGRAPTPPRLPRWPTEAPVWATDQATATGRADGSGLRGARAAEEVAVRLLRRQVEQFQLSPGLLVGPACDDRALARALDEAMASARVDETLYERQQVTVRVSMDLSVVWRRLSAAHAAPAADGR